MIANYFYKRENILEDTIGVESSLNPFAVCINMYNSSGELVVGEYLQHFEYIFPALN